MKHFILLWNKRRMVCNDIFHAEADATKKLKSVLLELATNTDSWSLHEICDFLNIEKEEVYEIGNCLD